MNQAVKLLQDYEGDDRAATAIEYGLIAGGISIAIVIVIMQVGISVRILFEQTAAIF